MRGFPVYIGAAACVVALGAGCSTSKRSVALSDSEIVPSRAALGYPTQDGLALAGDGVGLWLLAAGEGQAVGPMVLAMNVNGSPEFVAGDALGMMLITGNISALANVLEETTPTE